MLAVIALAGCVTPAAKDFGGTWKSVNRFQSAPTEIPLTQPYTFFAAPMDGTLKTMLTRWSKDSGMTLSYQLHSDFTLYTPVSGIHTSNVRAAAEQLSSIYVAEGVAVTVDGQKIVVQPASSTAPDATTNSSAIGASKPTATAEAKQ
ncbi:MAG TPA: hypothetical protein VNZ27_02510 [Rhodanobacter sp.]|nr:hypothetical protein [Rhodanobacter sp.]